MDFRLYSRNSRLYEEMLRDIREAGEYVFLETFICRDGDNYRREQDLLWTGIPLYRALIPQHSC